MSTLATPLSSATMFPRSPACLFSSLGPPWSFPKGLKWGPALLQPAERCGLSGVRSDSNCVLTRLQAIAYCMFVFIKPSTFQKLGAFGKLHEQPNSLTAYRINVNSNICCMGGGGKNYTPRQPVAISQLILDSYIDFRTTRSNYP